jgi:hypothetical protein
LSGGRIFSRFIVGLRATASDGCGSLNSRIGLALFVHSAISTGHLVNR